MQPTDTLEALEARARALVAPLVVVEVFPDTTGYDDVLGRRRAVLVVKVALAAPGQEDSRYQMKYLGRLDADAPNTALDALGVARRLAQRLGVPLYPDSAEPPTDATPAWLTQQGASPERTWHLTWRTTVWRPDGTTMDDAQERTVVATSGGEAIRRTYAELPRGQTPPFASTLSAADFGLLSSSYTEAETPAAAPPRETLWAMALDGRSLGAILRWMTAEAATLTPLDVMVTLEHAFLVDLRELAAAGAFCRGALSDDELEAALGPAVAAKKPQWSLLHALGRARSLGVSIGPVLRRHCPEAGGTFGVRRFELWMAVSDVFDLSITAAKTLVDAARDGEPDEALEGMLERAVKGPSCPPAPSR